ncbi:hypothetical protein EEL31_18985 [Brevibacillus laterosporus]|nr:hypothetical protein EEL31_18985 [Brevibacillus laterosporus]
MHFFIVVEYKDKQRKGPIGVNKFQEYVKKRLIWTVITSVILATVPYWIGTQNISLTIIWEWLILFSIVTIFDILSISSRQNIKK